MTSKRKRLKIKQQQQNDQKNELGSSSSIQESDTSDYFDHNNEKYQSMFNSDKEQQRLDKELIKQKRQRQKKFLQNIFCIIIFWNLITIVFYIVTLFLPYWFNLQQDQLNPSLKQDQQIWFSFLYVRHSQHHYQSYPEASQLLCQIPSSNQNQNQNQNQNSDRNININSMNENCEEYMNTLKWTGYICTIAVIISVLLCGLHCKRIYSLRQGEEGGMKGRFIFIINLFLFVGPPIAYIVVLASSSLNNIDSFKFSNLGFCYYFWCANVVLYFSMMLYYKKIKKRKQHDDLVNELLFQPSSTESFTLIDNKQQI